MSLRLAPDQFGAHRKCAISSISSCVFIWLSSTLCLTLLACLCESLTYLIMPCSRCWSSRSPLCLSLSPPYIHLNYTLYTNKHRQFKWSYCSSDTKINLNGLWGSFSLHQVNCMTDERKYFIDQMTLLLLIYSSIWESLLVAKNFGKKMCLTCLSWAREAKNLLHWTKHKLMELWHT